ncbi:hypothetical protein [Paracoccus aminophilus]|nr:hypothetical protein [Paracoccus aminophilus]
MKRNIYLLELEWDRLHRLLALRSLPIEDQNDRDAAEIALADAGWRLAQAGIMPVTLVADVEEVAVKMGLPVPH